MDNPARFHSRSTDSREKFILMVIKNGIFV